MELSVQQYRVLEEDSNYTELLDFSFSALCLLGKSDKPELNNEPCFISSRLEPINFSSNDFVAKFNELKEAVKECFDTEEEGEVNVAENMTMELETEEIVETETEIVEETTEEVAEVDETTKEEAAEEEVTVDYEAKYNDALSEIETLKAQVAELTQSVEALTPYKLAAEKAERESAENDVFAKYDSRIGEMAEYAELKTKAGEYSIADLERECLILVGKFAMTETKTEEVEPETEPTITFALDETVETKPSRYSDIYETYKSR
jgi:outer membrane murein-binding lipoprotein Lpp